MPNNFVLIFLILATAAFLSVLAGKLTWLAGIAGFIVGVFVFAGAGYNGIAMLAAFFILGTIATSIGIHKKQALGIAEKNSGKRNTGQVIANAGVAAIMGLLAFVMPEKAVLFRVMLAASLASATADTLSSELGNTYGRRFYNILTFEKDKRGLDGVVSIEGSFFGVLGSTCIAIIYATGYKYDLYFYLIIIGGTIGNFFDSVLGATLERKNYLDNNVVNFSNTAMAATVIYLIDLLR